MKAFTERKRGINPQRTPAFLFRISDSATKNHRVLRSDHQEHGSLPSRDHHVSSRYSSCLAQMTGLLFREQHTGNSLRKTSPDIWPGWNSLWFTFLTAGYSPFSPVRDDNSIILLRFLGWVTAFSASQSFDHTGQVTLPHRSWLVPAQNGGIHEVQRAVRSVNRR